MSLALDGQNISLACGMRQLLSSYSGPLLRAYNHSGPDLDYGIRDGGFDRQALDTNTAIWTAANKWYDQSSNGRDMPFNIVGDGTTAALRRVPVQATLGKRQITDNAASSGAQTWTTGSIYTADSGTLLWAGAIRKAVFNHVPPGEFAYQNGILFGDSGYLLINCRTNGSDSLYTVTALGWDELGSGLEDFVEIDNVERYASLRIAVRFQPSTIELSVNGSDWATADWHQLPPNALLEKFAIGTQGNEIHQGEVVASPDRLSNATISAWEAEAEEYWVGVSSGSGEPVSRTVQGAPMIFY